MLYGIMFGMPGPMELAIIAIIAVLLFGSKLPKVARQIGSAIPEFKRGLKGFQEEVDEIEESIKK